MRVRRTPTTRLVAVLAAAPSPSAWLRRPTRDLRPRGPLRRPLQPSRGGDKKVLKRYLADTWKSFEAMAVPATGLPADNIGGDLVAREPQRVHVARPTSAPTSGAPSPPATPA